jgi:hypothetical protein
LNEATPDPLLFAVLAVIGQLCVLGNAEKHGFPFLFHGTEDQCGKPSDKDPETVSRLGLTLGCFVDYKLKITCNNMVSRILEV